MPGLRRFTARRALFSFLGPILRVYDPTGALRWVVKPRPFRPREEMVVYRDEARTTPAVRIRARSALDVRSTYDVLDPAGHRLGCCKREGVRSLLRDTWTLRAPDDTTLATIQEDRLLFSLLRRFLLQTWLPRAFTVRSSDGAALGHLRQRMNPLQRVYDGDFGGDGPGALDARLALAITVLLLTVEARGG